MNHESRFKNLLRASCFVDHPAPTPAARGMTLIEALVGSALILIVFLAIFAVFQVSIDLVFSTKAATGANALVNEQVEYVRGLAYDSIGTAGGIPSGQIPQVQQKTLNGITYVVSTLVQYVDDPADGTDTADENDITADYKLVKISVDWTVRGKPRTTFAVTRIAPHGIETLAEGGTLRVNVFDILADGVSGATVHIVNTTLSPAIDVSIDTGSSGSVVFPGAPPGAGYQITVTKNGYSSAQTYSATSENPNPNPGYVSVVDKTTTTVSLEINLLGSLTVSTWSPKGPGSFDDTFTNQSLLSEMASTTVSGSSLVLLEVSGSHAASGSASSIALSPAYVTDWSSLSWDATTPTDTSALVFLYYWNGAAYILVPDTDLPGNSAGFSNEFVDLSALPVATYGRLRITAELASADPAVTPAILDWHVAFIAGPTPLPNVQFSIHGVKTIGTTAGGVPIYKMNETDTTTQYGTWAITPIEPDAYTITLPAGSPYVIAEECPNAPSVAPGIDATVSLTLEDATANSLRVIVSGNGNPLPNAAVLLEGGSVNENETASACGQALFLGVPGGTYTVTVSASGYQSAVDSNVSVSGAAVLSVTLSP